MSESTLKLPHEKTLEKYGLSLDEWLSYLPVDDEGRRVCRICERVPPSGRFVVDHKHAPGWAKMPPERRKLYVRGVVCTVCNHFVLTRYATAKHHENAAAYLREFEERLEESLRSLR